MCQSEFNTAYNWLAYADRRAGLVLIRRNKILVDTVIETQDGYLDQVHWQAMIALCPKLLDAAVVKRTNHLILPQEINGSLARNLIDCAYGQDVLFNQVALNELYAIAVRYQIDHSIKVCLNFAKTLLNVHNCIQLFLLSLKHRHQTLKRASYSMIRDNFKFILFVNPDFHLLQKDCLKRLLLDDSLKLDEDEELVWVAIVRWLRPLLTSTDLYEIYNQMVRVNLSNSVTGNSIINFNRPLTGNSLKTMIQQQQPVTHLFSELIKRDSSLDLSKRRRSRRDQNLYELIKCLRFMRFKSLDAFNVMLSSELIQRNTELAQLVQYMKLRYILRKKIPIDKELIKQMLPEGSFRKIKRTEVTLQERLVKSATRIVQCHQILPRVREFNQLSPGDLLAVVSNVTSKEKTNENQINQLDERVMEKIDSNWLKRSIEPRVPSSIALLIGGWCEGSVRETMLAYDFVCDKWFKLNIRLPEPRAFHVSCSSPKTGQVFIVGGTNGKEILNSVLIFDPTDNVFSEDRSNKESFNYRFSSVCPMSERRCHLSGLFHSDGRLYALGGHNGVQRLRSGEWFDPCTNQWHPIADMTIPRSDASACSHDNKIFIAGGQIGDQFIQASVEFYKPNDDTWTFAAPMIVPRMSFKLVSHRSHLLAIGGTNGLMNGDEIASVTRSVERYNHQQATWSLCAPMGQKRSSFGTMQIGDNLFVVGGHGGHCRLKTCESLRIGHFSSPTNNLRTVQSPVAPTFRPPVHGTPHHLAQRTQPDHGQRSAMRWIKQANLPAKRSGFSLAVVNHLKNSKEFTYHGSKKTTTFIKKRTYWHRFKIIKRRKLVKHLKIALVVTVIILIM